MSPELIVLISLAIFGIMLIAEAPVAAALLTASISGLLLNAGFERTAATLVLSLCGAFFATARSARPRMRRSIGAPLSTESSPKS